MTASRLLCATAILGLQLLSPPVRAAVRPAAEGTSGMVVTAQHLASDVGLQILQAGGNAVDAAVAVGYAQAVVNPCCGNIGGGGFMVLHLADGRERFLDFREQAPAAASRDMYLDKSGKPIEDASLYGWLAAGVPGTVMGLDRAEQEYGRLGRAAVMAPAIRLAREGFFLTRGDTDILAAKTDRFRAQPEIAKIFLHSDGTPLQPGERLAQPALADTLEAIAKDGPDAFYKGRIPEAVAKAAKAGGGILTAEDFALYHTEETAPLACSYRGYTIVSAPPPSSGGVTLCEILNILGGYDLKAMGWHSAAEIHVLVEAMRHAYLDRNTFLGDPDFVGNPLTALLSQDYAARIRAALPPDRAVPNAAITPGDPTLKAGEKPETTHYSVLDKDGNAVSVTYTINGLFGALVMAPGTGFFINDEMDDFTAKPGAPNGDGLVQGVANAIAPGKRPLSSMAPTIVTRDGHVAMVLGSPGGSRIISIVLEVLVDVVDYGMRPQEAVNAPRIHHQGLPDRIEAEPYALSPDTEKLLAGMGYKIEEQTPWGAAELIEVGPAKPAGSAPVSSGHDSALGGQLRPGVLYGASDDRRAAGSAAGY